MVRETLVSVIIVTWNSAKCLPRCIQWLEKQTWPQWELIAVDNGSIDNSVEIVGNLAPYSYVVENRENLGYSSANNQGIERAKGEYVLILNPDVLLDPNFIRHMVDTMTQRPACGMSTGKVYRGWPESNQFDKSLPLDNTGHLIYRNRRIVDRGRWEEDKGQYDSQEEVFSGFGGALFLRTTMLEGVKLAEPREYLDSLFFAYKEEVDLCWRGRLYGWKCIYVPQAIAYHLRGWGGGGLKHRRERSKSVPLYLRRHSFKNRYYLMLKNDSLASLARDALFILWYEIRVFGYLLICEPAVLPAIVEVLSSLSKVLRYRQVIQSRRRITDKAIRQFLV